MAASPPPPPSSVSTATETKLERRLRRTSTLKRKDRKVYREVDRLAPILARLVSLLEKKPTDTQQFEIIDRVDDMGIVEGRCSQRLGERWGLDEIRLDLTGERVPLRIAVEKLSSSLISLIRTIDTSDSNVRITNAKLRALLAYHTFCRGVEVRVAEEADDDSSEEGE